MIKELNKAGFSITQILNLLKYGQTPNTKVL